MMKSQKQFLCKKSDSGSVLVVCIWVLVIFSILNVGLYKITFSQAKIYKNIELNATSEYLAKAAYFYIKKIRSKDKTTYESFYELRKLREKELGKGKFKCVIIDEESKININVISENILAQLPGLNEGIAENIVKARKDPFYFKEQLLDVEGITEEIFDQIKDHVTTYGNGKINFNTASDAVLSALGIDDFHIKVINEYRAGSDAELATEDDRYFEGTGKILDNLREFTGIFTEQQLVILDLINKGIIGVESDVLTLQVDTEYLGKPVMKYYITMDEEGIKQWREM
ncbi:MAG: helix-hairpin-helix domain-containing protein [Candidatus Omnitrophota bacterium]